MKINLAVYTAIHGYDWQPGTVYQTSDLVRYKRGIGRLPDPLMEELPFGGVFNDGDTVVFSSLWTPATIASPCSGVRVCVRAHVRVHMVSCTFMIPLRMILSSFHKSKLLFLHYVQPDIFSKNQQTNLGWGIRTRLSD